MVYIDPELEKQFRLSGAKPVPVIITCESHCEAVIDSLKSSGIRIIDTGFSDMGSFLAEITKPQMDLLLKLSGITAIECQEGVEALSD